MIKAEKECIDERRKSKQNKKKRKKIEKKV